MKAWFEGSRSKRHSLCRGLASGLSLTVLAWSLSGCGGTNEPEPESGCTDESTLCTWAGLGEAGFDGDGNSLRESMFYWPIDLTFTKSGEAYVVDWNNHAIRRLTSDGTLETVIGSGFVGDGPRDQSDLEAPGAPGTEVDLNHPTQLVELPSDKLLLVSWHNHKLREYDPETGLVVVTCGSGAGFSGDGEPAREAEVNQPTQVVVDEDNNQFILDMRNQVIRRIDADGLMQTVAGIPGEAGYSGDGGPPLEAHFSFPSGSNPSPGGALALDGDGRLYVSDTLNHVIRRIDFEADVIETIAGTGEAGFSGDGDDATSAELNNPRDLAIDADSRYLYVADEFNDRVRVIDLETGSIDTIAGSGEVGYDGEGKPPSVAALNGPGGLALDSDGLLYIVDTYNNRIRVFDPEKVR